MALTPFARQNHVLVPDSSAERDRYRHTRVGRVLGVVASVLRRFSQEGSLLLLLAAPAALAALDVRRSQSHVAWGALVGLLAASFVVSFAYRLRGVRASVSVPRRVAMGAATHLTVVLDNEGDASPTSLRVRGPFLPWDGQWQQRATGLAVLRRGARARATLIATFHRRGEHHLDPVRVQALVPLGLALGPPLFTEAPRFLVVPKVANVTSLTLPRARRHHPGGVPRVSHLADSRELAGVRPYRPGDPVRDLHTKTWARTGVPHVREYQEEFFTHVAVVVDAATTERKRKRYAEDTPLEAALSLAAGVVERLLRGETLIDLFVVGERVAGAQAHVPGAAMTVEAPRATPLGRGRGTLEVALDRLAAVEREAPLDVEVSVEPLLAERDRFAAIVLVCSEWDARREALAKKLETAGLAALVLVTLPEGEHAAGAARTVPAQAILRGAAVPL